MRYLLVTLLIASATIWGYNFGSIMPALQQTATEDVAWAYIQDNCEHLGDVTGNKWYECNQ